MCRPECPGDGAARLVAALKDRFQQFIGLARELLKDIREAEHNFRGLDRRVRERIALWGGAKGALLKGIMGERGAIADSDQGRSFCAFRDFSMSQSHEDELKQLLERVLSLPLVAAMKPELRLRRVHHNWLMTGEQAQGTVAQLPPQLRRLIDDQVWLENRASENCCEASKPERWHCAARRHRATSTSLTIPPATSGCRQSARCTARRPKPCLQMGCSKVALPTSMLRRCFRRYRPTGQRWPAASANSSKPEPGSACCNGFLQGRCNTV